MLGLRAPRDRRGVGVISPLCWLGVHDWALGEWGSLGRRACRRCGKEQELQFYSNRTHAWVDLPDALALSRRRALASAMRMTTHQFAPTRGAEHLCAACGRNEAYVFHRGPWDEKE